MNRQGQEGASFRLLIEAVLIVFILVIILGVVSQIDEWRWRISERRLFEGFNKALNSPDGSIIFEKEIVLRANSSYSNRAFASTVAGIDSECIEIHSSDSSAFIVTDASVIEITTVIQTNVYYKCLPGIALGEDQCPDYCLISFGKDLKEED